MKRDQPTLLPGLGEFVSRRTAEFAEISVARREVLLELSSFVSQRLAEDLPIRLIFICTHNSRRSHMAQLWAETAAAVYGVNGVETYSGGTEAAAFNPRAVAALQRAGFLIAPFTDGANPIYEVSFAEGMEPIQAFSKVYDEAPNHTDDCAAVMTCSSADAECPIVRGAIERIAIPYDDPKASDGNGRETEVYDERCAQIAREMLWVFSEVSRRS